jgi:hypothetical protein
MTKSTPNKALMNLLDLLNLLNKHFGMYERYGLLDLAGCNINGINDKGYLVAKALVYRRHSFKSLFQPRQIRLNFPDLQHYWHQRQRMPHFHMTSLPPPRL